MCRSAVAAELAKLVRDVAVEIPTWESLHALMCFPKLVLRSSKRAGVKHQRQAAHDMDRRLRLFKEGQLGSLWLEAMADAKRVPSERPMRTRQTAQMEEDGVMPTAQVGKIRALVEEGALSKAAKLLLSQGLADSRDPTVDRVLRELHPPPQPHMVAGDALPSSAPGGLAHEGEEAEKAEIWAKRAWSAITSFPPGSAGGPSGLRPTHLKEVCRKLGAGAPLVQALGAFAETALTKAFPANVREVMCASSLIPL
jgi:hypothetical protein